MRKTPSRSGIAAAIAVMLLAPAAPAAFAAEKTASPAAAAAQPVRARPRVPQFPADVKAMGEKLQGMASAAVKAWASQNATAVKRGPGDPETLARTAAHTRWPNLRAGSSDALVFLLIYDAAESAKAEIQNTLDSKSELGETESLRLQMAMDRVSKFMTTLSNLLKKISDTEAGIVQNLK